MSEPDDVPGLKGRFRTLDARFLAGPVRGRATGSGSFRGGFVFVGPACGGSVRVEDGRVGR